MEYNHPRRTVQQRLHELPLGKFLGHLHLPLQQEPTDPCLPTLYSVFGALFCPILAVTRRGSHYVHGGKKGVLLIETR